MKMKIFYSSRDHVHRRISSLKNIFIEVEKNAFFS